MAVREMRRIPYQASPLLANSDSGPLHAEHILLRKHLGNELGTIANVQLGIDSPAM